MDNARIDYLNERLKKYTTMLSSGIMCTEKRTDEEVFKVDVKIAFYGNQQLKRRVK